MNSATILPTMPLTSIDAEIDFDDTRRHCLATMSRGRRRFDDVTGFDVTPGRRVPERCARSAFDDRGESLL
jgi:hypothetical protein